MKTHIPYFLIVATLTGMSVESASATGTLLHRYSFNDDTANDSVGTANGTLRSGSTISGGVLNTASTTPNGGVSLTSAATSGITGNFTIETYISVANLDQTYAAVYSFAAGPGNQNLLFASSTNSPNANNAQIRVFANPEPGGERTANQSLTSFTLNTLAQVVATFDQSTGTLSFYTNGVFQNSVTNAELTTLNFSQLTVGAIGTQVSYNDPSFTGFTDDFRIYSGALTANEITALNALGANATNSQIFNAVPEPTSIGLLSLGTLLLGLRRRRNA